MSDQRDEPDLIYISNENSQIMKTGIEGVPDLLVEILSPSTGEHDKVPKKELYQRFGVKEYWIVDARHRTVDQFGLENGKYRLERTCGSFDTLVTERFPCIRIEMKNLFQVLEKVEG
ncbi:Uma2 family endonuclease [Cohnella sp. CFH 77786]|uniref:Uma2 family endonuclease n=1 Tax=Cohnella sp. CFH 77786 TaxID=2662265 RepID=UPI001C60B4AA|nr:Uma2 family endonuclease [Cohnella sp. CFH 77786]